MKNWQLYDIAENKVIAESNETLELELLKENFLRKNTEKFPKKDFTNNLIIKQTKND